MIAVAVAAIISPAILGVLVTAAFWPIRKRLIPSLPLLVAMGVGVGLAMV